MAAYRSIDRDDRRHLRRRDPPKGGHMTSTTNCHAVGRGLSIVPLSLTLAVLSIGCGDSGRSFAPTATTRDQPGATFTAATNTSVPLARGTFWHPIDLKRETDGWELEMKISPNADLAVSRVLFAAGTHSGWHSHPGPVFVQVLTGTVRFYLANDPTCTPIVRTAGETYVESGEITHIARNETTEPAENLAVYFAPKGTPLRHDEPNPGNCPF